MMHTLEIAMQAVRNMPERSGFYTAEELIMLELNHLRLMEAAQNALAYLNPNLYAYASLQRAVEQAETIRKVAGLS